MNESIKWNEKERAAIEAGKRRIAERGVGSKNWRAATKLARKIARMEAENDKRGE